MRAHEPMPRRPVLGIAILMGLVGCGSSTSSAPPPRPAVAAVSVGGTTSNPRRTEGPPSASGVGADGDLDGIPDDADLCPSEPEDRDGFEDVDGCPDPDNDRDRIADPNDMCPNDPETPNGVADADGCPD